MTDEPETSPGESEAPPTTTDVELAYAGASRLVATEGSAELKLFGNVKRDPVRFHATVREPLKLREALATVYQIVGSDYRYVPKDRSAYQAYRRMKSESAGMGAWKAQQAYFDWLMRNDPLAFLILDPIISVYPDQLSFEVFSKDEGAYARLSVDQDAFDSSEKPACGTTNIDFSKSLIDSVLQMRTYRSTDLLIDQQDVQVETDGGEDVLEKEIRIPDSWIRGFLQVQSAATLPRDVFSLAPMDLYNILRHLRMNADQKGKRRGLRVELVPGEQPTVVLEPWETVLPCSAEPYKGTQARVVRIWGRRRLMMLRRLLPFVRSIDVHVLGSGLPVFWVLKCEHMTLTLGLTGFTSANWSQAAAFDLLLPRKTQDSAELTKVVKFLSKEWYADEAAISKATKLSGEQLKEALQLGCQLGQLMFDLEKSVYRLRPLTNVPLDFERLEYRNINERRAYDLLDRKSAVSISSENRIVGTGVELTGKVMVAEDKREYRPQILINDDGFVTKAECTCNVFRRQGLKAGPCTCLVALRLAYAKREAERKASGKSRKTITVETRTYSQRSSRGERVYQVTLDRKKLRISWGTAGQRQRVQHLRFNSVDEARDEYLGRIDELVAKGYLDASA